MIEGGRKEGISYAPPYIPSKRLFSAPEAFLFVLGGEGRGRERGGGCLPPFPVLLSAVYLHRHRLSVVAGARFDTYAASVGPSARRENICLHCTFGVYARIVCVCGFLFGPGS